MIMIRNDISNGVLSSCLLLTNTESLKILENKFIESYKNISEHLDYNFAVNYKFDFIDIETDIIHSYFGHTKLEKFNIESFLKTTKRILLLDKHDNDIFVNTIIYKEKYDKVNLTILNRLWFYIQSKLDVYDLYSIPSFMDTYNEYKKEYFKGII